MARGINKVILVGNLGKDPETRRIPGSGASVANVTIATSESWRDKQSGEQKERTEWHNLVFYEKLADIVAQHLGKGSQIYVEGQLRTRKWQGNDGQDRYTTEIICNKMQMLGGRGQGQSGNVANMPNRGQQQGGYNQPQQQPPQQQGGYNQPPQQHAANAGPGYSQPPADDWGAPDDIPF